MLCSTNVRHVCVCVCVCMCTCMSAPVHILFINFLSRSSSLSSTSAKSHSLHSHSVLVYHWANVHWLVCCRVPATQCGTAPRCVCVCVCVCVRACMRFNINACCCLMSYCLLCVHITVIVASLNHCIAKVTIVIVGILRFPL